MIKVFETAKEGIKNGVKNGTQWVKDNSGRLIAGAGAIVGTVALVLIAGKLADGHEEDDYYELDESEFEVYDVDDDDSEDIEEVDVDVTVED